jgi:DNA-binding LacI/PurR family transcriptional regulator
MPRVPARKVAKAAAPPAGPQSDARRLQMSDVARLAGVSVSTVSRALSGSPLIGAETRKRIRDLAQSLHYSIDIGAQNLRLRQNRTIAVVLSFDRRTRQPTGDPFAESMLSTLADELNERGYNMLLARVDADRIDAIADLVGTGRAIGILAIGQQQHHERLNELAARGYPIVVWGASLPQQLYCTVASDNVAGGYEATRHLIASACKRIAFFGDVAVPEVAQRYDGHCRALSEGGLPINPVLCVSAGFHADDARRATLGLLRRGVMFDAIFACSDSLAIATISTLRELNVRVPEDIAVVGYDDIELASYFHPPLTTVRQPMRAAGRALIDALFDRINGKRTAPILLPTELVVRMSSTRPSRRRARRPSISRT